MVEKQYCSIPGWLGFFPYFRKYAKLFNPACKCHDECYAEACDCEHTQADCDTDFFIHNSEIALAIDDPVERDEALQAAWIFYTGVTIGGDKSYNEVVASCPINPKSLVEPETKVYA